MAVPTKKTDPGGSADGTTNSQTIWLRFVDAGERLMQPQKKDRPLDQLLPFRDKACYMVRTPAFLAAFDVAVQQVQDLDGQGVKPAFLMELEGITRAAEVAQSTKKPSRWSKVRKWLLAKASVGVGSAKDLLEDLPPWAKNSLTLFKEALDLFRSGS